MYHKWHRQKLIQRRHWPEKKMEVSVYSSCVIRNKMWCHSFFPQSGQEQQSVGHSRAEALRAFYWAELHFFSPPRMQQSDQWRCLTSSSLLLTSLLPHLPFPLSSINQSSPRHDRVSLTGTKEGIWPWSALCVVLATLYKCTSTRFCFFLMLQKKGCFKWQQTTQRYAPTLKQKMMAADIFLPFLLLSAAAATQGHGVAHFFQSRTFPVRSFSA